MTEISAECANSTDGDSGNSAAGDGGSDDDDDDTAAEAGNADAAVAPSVCDEMQMARRR